MKQGLTIFKNDEGFYRVKFDDHHSRWLVDADLMIAIVSSHKDEVLTFLTRRAAENAIQEYYERCENLIDIFKEKEEPKKPVYSDTWKEN